MLACALGCLRRENQRGARTARFSWAFGSYGGRAVLRGFCGGAIFCYRGCAPGWLRGARFLASWTVRVVFAYAFSPE